MQLSLYGLFLQKHISVKVLTDVIGQSYVSLSITFVTESNIVRKGMTSFSVV